MKKGSIDFLQKFTLKVWRKCSMELIWNVPLSLGNTDETEKRVYATWLPYKGVV